MNNITFADWIALTLLIIGGINWGFIAVLNIDLVSTLFGVMTPMTRIIYGLVALSGIYLIASALIAAANDTSTTYIANRNATN